MGAEGPISARQILEREQARLLEEAATKEAAAKEAVERAAVVARDMAELDRILATYNVVLSTVSSDAIASIWVSELIASYKQDKRSNYHKLRHRTRVNYDGMLRRIESDFVKYRVADLTAEILQQQYAIWADDGKKLPMAHSRITLLRTIVGFGATTLKDRDCERLEVILHKLHFKAPPSRSEYLTESDVFAVRKQAHLDGWPMIALAQAIQFDTPLGQIDTIGEWVPNDEPGVSEITSARYGKWLRGLRWNEIDDNLVLRHVTSKKLKLVEFDLKRAQTVIEELKLMYCSRGEPLTRARLPNKGAVIVDREGNLPFLTHKFRRLWRDIATKAGIPPHIKNMDSRREPNEKRTAGRSSAVRQ